MKHTIVHNAIFQSAVAKKNVCVHHGMYIRTQHINMDCGMCAFACAAYGQVCVNIILCECILVVCLHCKYEQTGGE